MSIRVFKLLPLAMDFFAKEGPHPFAMAVMRGDAVIGERSLFVHSFCTERT